MSFGEDLDKQNKPPSPPTSSNHKENNGTKPKNDEEEFEDISINLFEKLTNVFKKIMNLFLKSFLKLDLKRILRD